MQDAQNIIETINLVKDYDSIEGKIRALDNINVKIPSGAVALIGPNGSGKSTLIRTILGLLEPSEGEIIINQEKNHGNIRGNIGYFPEQNILITKVNAVKFISHFGQLSGLSKSRSMQRTHEVLDYVGLGEERYRVVEKYSTGMKQRLLFALSLVHDPDLIILDEPTSGLSPEGREEMLGLIKEINKKYHKSILFSTHILKDVENICDYAIVLNKGKIIFEGGIEEIKKFQADTIILEVDNHKDAVLDELIKLGYKASLSKERICIESDGTLDLKKITEIVTKFDSRLISLKNHEPNLQDLFLHLIDRDIDQYNNNNNNGGI